MSLSFPNGSDEKMRHRYALFKDPDSGPIFLSAAGGLSSTSVCSGRALTHPPLNRNSVGRQTYVEVAMVHIGSGLQEAGRVATINDYLHLVLEEHPYPFSAWVFRGQREADWLPVPKIDRQEFVQYRSFMNYTRKRHEEHILGEFLKRARPYVVVEPATTWEWLATAQHHGLSTRLLDWTANPLTALYFAVEGSNDNRDSAVWCYRHSGKSWTDCAGPFTIRQVTSFVPPHISSRIAAQAGCFTVHPSVVTGPPAPWAGEIRRIVIIGEARSTLRTQLSSLGITRGSLFPDLDGLSAETNWLLSSYSLTPKTKRPIVVMIRRKSESESNRHPRGVEGIAANQAARADG